MVINRRGRLAGKVSADPKPNRKAAELRTHWQKAKKWNRRSAEGKPQGGPCSEVDPLRFAFRLRKLPPQSQLNRFTDF